MAVFVPVSGVEVPTTASFSSTGASTNGDFAPLIEFLQDHFVKGGYQGGKIVHELLQTIQTSADAGKSELLRSLPDIGRHLRDVPGALRDLFSEDPRAMREVERRFGNISRDVAAATSTGVLLGLCRLVNTAMPFTVAAGAVLGAAVGGERLDVVLQFLRASSKED